MADNPRIGITLGDPASINPEVVAKALATGQVQKIAEPVVIGSAWAIEQGIKLIGSDLKVRRVESVEGAGTDPKTIDVLDNDAIKPEQIQWGVASAEGGKAQLSWNKLADELTDQGKLAGIVSCPVNSTAIKLAGIPPRDSAVEPGSTYLFLASGPLRVVHMTDHITVRESVDWITKANVTKVLNLMHTSLGDWGMPNPRIGVASFNAHGFGPEDENEVKPAVDEAKARGINATGPIPADSVFRQCIEGEYDIVLAMYHDQGHIAVKTWGFIGNIALVLGSPYIRVSVAHGTAYDIVNKGIAHHEMILAAMKTTATLAAGKGFPKD